MKLNLLVLLVAFTEAAKNRNNTGKNVAKAQMKEDDVPAKVLAKEREVESAVPANVPANPAKGVTRERPEPTERPAAGNAGNGGAGAGNGGNGGSGAGNGPNGGAGAGNGPNGNGEAETTTKRPPPARSTTKQVTTLPTNNPTQPQPNPSTPDDPTPDPITTTDSRPQNIASQSTDMPIIPILIAGISFIAVLGATGLFIYKRGKKRSTEELLAVFRHSQRVQTTTTNSSRKSLYGMKENTYGGMPALESFDATTSQFAGQSYGSYGNGVYASPVAQEYRGEYVQLPMGMQVRDSFMQPVQEVYIPNAQEGYMPNAPIENNMQYGSYAHYSAEYYQEPATPIRNSFLYSSNTSQQRDSYNQGEEYTETTRVPEHVKPNRPSYNETQQQYLAYLENGML